VIISRKDNLNAFVGYITNELFFRFLMLDHWLALQEGFSIKGQQDNEDKNILKNPTTAW
jgi:hypothetical protein